MRSKIILYTILIFTFITTQVTILNFITVFGITPNIIIILIVSISLLEGRIDGGVLGFSAGLCLDAVTGITLGFNALLGMLLGLGLGNINKRFFKENVFLMTFCTFISTILYESAVTLSSFMFSLKVDFFSTFKTVILPEAIVNSVLGGVIFFIIVRINKRIIGAENKNKY